MKAAVDAARKATKAADSTSIPEMASVGKDVEMGATGDTTPAADDQTAAPEALWEAGS